MGKPLVYKWEESLGPGKHVQEKMQPTKNTSFVCAVSSIFMPEQEQREKTFHPMETARETTTSHNNNYHVLRQTITASSRLRWSDWRTTKLAQKLKIIAFFVMCVRRMCSQRLLLRTFAGGCLQRCRTQRNSKSIILFILQLFDLLYLHLPDTPAK